MKTCINGATTMPYSPEKDLEAAGEAGFQGVEIWKTKLDEFLTTNKEEALADLLSTYNLHVPAICPFGGYVWCPESEFTKKLEEIRRYFEIAAYVNCESLLVCAEQIQSKSPRENIKAHVSRMSRLADLGKEYNVKIAIEWFQSLKDVTRIVETSSNENLGMIIDTFYWFRGDGDIRNIDLVPVKKLYLVHINDCEDFPKEKLTDKNRIYMGQGVIPLVEILQKLEGINYEGK
jgi:2-keto-myo-inositol isomerase